MAQTLSEMLSLGTPMPEFSLPDTEMNIVDSTDLAGKPVLVIFMCNHCPFVKHIIEVLNQQAEAYQKMGIAVVGINSNDAQRYRDDSPDNMRIFARETKMTFPYLYDETQETAKAFKAACTPDFFLFDKEHRLVYRGQFDDSRPSKEVPVTGKDLNAAAAAAAEGNPIPGEQKPSIGCSIKWKPGSEPEYFTGM